MYSMSSGPNAMNFHVWPGLGFGEIVADRDRRGRRVEVLFDVVEPQEPARGRHVQRAVPHRDAIGLIEAAGDHHDSIGLVVAVAIHDRVHLAGGHRSDEHGPLRPERHVARVLDLLGEHVRVKSRRNDQRAKRRRRLARRRRRPAARTLEQRATTNARVDVTTAYILQRRSDPATERAGRCVRPTSSHGASEGS